MKEKPQVLLRVYRKSLYFRYCPIRAGEEEMAKARWIRTECGWAGRKGFIMQAPKGETCKYVYQTYSGGEKLYSDLISDLKKNADQE
jgi:hypothetical protein